MAESHGTPGQPSGDGPSSAVEQSESAVRRLGSALHATASARRAAWALAILVALTLLWIGAELHYRGCVEAAAQRNPGDDDLSRLVRGRDIEGCSRLPF